MNEKTFKIIRLIIVIFVAIIVATAVNLNNFILALTGVIIGMLFLFIVRKKSKIILVDERVELMSGRAGRATYAIQTLMLAFLTIIFYSSSHRTNELYMEALGMIFSYLTLFSVAVYTISYKYYQKKYGANE